MADQPVNHGDDAIKSSAASIAEKEGNEKTYSVLHEELSGERNKSMPNSLNESKAVAGLNKMENGSLSADAADALANAARKGLLKDAGKGSDKSSAIAEAIGQAMEKSHVNENGKISDQIKKLTEGLETFTRKDGVDKLPTGDFLVREDGKQTLFTPAGDRVTVNPDGTNVVKGDVKSVATDKHGETTVKFGDGATVTFDKAGIRSVSRGNESVSFMHPDNRMPFPDLDPKSGTWNKLKEEPDLRSPLQPNSQIEKDLRPPVLRPEIESPPQAPFKGEINKLPQGDEREQKPNHTKPLDKILPYVEIGQH